VADDTGGGGDEVTVMFSTAGTTSTLASHSQN
jgi:hypothetical protein